MRDDQLISTDDCVFCDIVEGKAPATFITRWVDAIAIVPLDPVTPGHTLVIPKRHTPDALSWPLITGDMFARAAELAYTVNPNGSYNLITSVGTPATQTIFHLHVHIVPRHVDDGLALPWTGQQVSDVVE